MIDYARINIKAGDGGRGAGSFMHLKGKRRGKADGGDGGRGGDVYISAGAHINTLESFRYVKEYKASSGEQGFSKNRTGAEGKPLEIKVPLGTMVKVKDRGDYDIVNKEQRILVARGGEGGKGNAHLRDKYGRRPFSGEPGKEGEIVEVELELKLIADIGLVGLPNAGKSTLISALTAAKPKIANYPFTTLEPNLGVMEVRGSRVVIADIPGLIEGASEGKGLGDLFLRHIERTKVIVHVVDITADNIWDDYQTIRGELKAYSRELAKKKEVIVLNKTDLVSKEEVGAKTDIFKKRRKKAYLISAEKKIGLVDLSSAISKKI